MKSVGLLLVLFSVAFADDYSEDDLEGNMEDDFLDYKARRNTLIVFITGEDLERILSSTMELEAADVNDENFPITFLDEFKNFVISFDWKENKTKSILKAAAEYNENHFTNDSDDAIHIWLSFQPRYDHHIEDDMEQVMDAANEVNFMFFGTVSTVVLDYGLLTLDHQSLPLVNHEITKVNQRIKGGTTATLKFALKLEIMNCQSRVEYLKNLKLNLVDAFLLISAKRENILDNPIILPSVMFQHIPCWNLLLSESLPALDTHIPIKINLDEELYYYRRDVAKRFQEDFQEKIFFLKMALPIVLFVEVDKDNTSDSQVERYEETENEVKLVSLLQEGLDFNKKHFGAVITLGQNNSKRSFESFGKLWIVIGSIALETQLQELEELANYLKSGTKARLESENASKINLLVAINKNDFHINKDQIDKAVAIATFLNKLKPEIVNKIVIDWMTCADSELCNGYSNLSYACAFEKTSNDLLYVWNYTESALEKVTHTSTVQAEFPVDYQIYETYVSKLFGEKIDNHCEDDISLPMHEAESVLCKAVVHSNNFDENGAMRTYNYVTGKMNECHNLLSSEAFEIEISSYYVEVVGCRGRYSSVSSLAQFALFYKLLSKWATSGNRTLYVSAGLENPAECQQTYNQSVGYVCTCGWWVVTNTSFDDEHVYDKKTLALLLHKSQQKSDIFAVVETSNRAEILQWVLLTTLFLGVIITVSASVLIFRYQSKYILTQEEVASFIKGRLESKTGISSSFSNGSESAQCEPYNKIKYELTSSSFTIDTSTCLGSGEFGKVFRGTLKQNGTKKDTAVKVANVRTLGKSHGGRLAINGLLSEIKILSYLGEHVHVVCLLGAYTAKLRKGDISIFLELCEVGSLYKYLRSINPQTVEKVFHVDESDIQMMDLNNLVNTHNEYQQGELNADLSNELYRFAGQIACGMEFVASKNVVHADLAARNVLLTSDKVVKISDFGLSRRMYDYTEYVKQNQAPLPWRWMAPESLRRMMFNEKTDVWAFGITLWEIFTLGDEPYPGLSWHENFPAMLSRGLHPNAPRYNVKDIYSLMKQCWSINSFDRLTFAELNSEMNEMQIVGNE